jgi:hypothetical protein
MIRQDAVNIPVQLVLLTYRFNLRAVRRGDKDASAKASFARRATEMPVARTGGADARTTAVSELHVHRRDQQCPVYVDTGRLMHAAACATISLCPLFLRRRIPLARAVPSIFLGGQFCRSAKVTLGNVRLSREPALTRRWPHAVVSLEPNRSRQQQQRTRAQLGLKEVSKDGRDV